MGGSLILANIYFNGAGVQRDLPLAMRFACEANEQMGGAGAVDAIANQSTLSDPGSIEICDYASAT